MIVCATGHRPNKLGGYGLDVKTKLEQLAFTWLEEHKPDKAISGMALGWDQAFARAAIELNIPLVAAIPFTGQEQAWPDSSQKEWKRLVDAAYEVVIVSEGGYAAWKMQKRNEWMVDQSDMVLALWDGSSGGTCNCIKYANKVSRPISNLWTNWLEVQLTERIS